MLKPELQNAIDRWSSSLIRPLVPPKLISNSSIKSTVDDGAKLIYAKFYYGVQTGRFKLIPFNGSYGNVINDANQESLWLYTLKSEPIPPGFEAKTYDSFIIRTGRVQKCSACRGHGEVTCSSCRGKIRWTEKFGDRIVEKVCSCGNGRERCGSCTGYGEMETVIDVTKKFHLFETKNSQYKGEVPEAKIKKITGGMMFERVIEYPHELVKRMLAGGIDAEEFNQLNTEVLEGLHEMVNAELSNKEVNTELINDQLNALFNSVPNPGKENKFLEKEVMPVRVLIRLENAPVTQVDYTYKGKNYSLWIFGNENKVWHKSIPSSFNYKILIILFGLLAIVSILLMR